MIYPADWNITILQNSSWRGVFRATSAAKTVTSMAVSAGVPTFTADCHGLLSGDRVVFTSPTGTPCGLAVNTVYYVISGGLTASQFRVSATSGGSALTLTDTVEGVYPVAFTVAKPINLTGYVLDSDIRDLGTLAQVATFSISLVSAVDGSFEMSLSPATTNGLATGTYGYDLYMTSPGGERYYYLRGSATVERTLSRA